MEKILTVEIEYFDPWKLTLQISKKMEMFGLDGCQISPK